MENKYKKNYGLIFFALISFCFSVFLAFKSYEQFLEERLGISIIFAACSFAFLFTIFYIFLKVTSISKDHSENIKEAFKYDALTHLPNSNYFRELVQFKIEETKKENLDDRLYLVKLGFERFRFIQNNFGILFSEQLFKDIAEELTSVLDEDDELSRVEGEGFLIITRKKEVEILNYIRKINNIFNQTYSPTGMSEEIYISIKMGLAFWDKDFSLTYDEVAKQAHSAYLYAINQNSKDFYKSYNKSIQNEDALNVQLEHLLREAIEKDEIMVYFQPKIGKDGKIKSAEALARWYSKEKQQFIRPDIFINTAEDIGIIEDIGKHIMELSIKELKKWHDEGYTEMKVAVNVSTKQFNRELPKLISSLLSKYKIKPKYLEVEVTESALVTDKNVGTDLLHKIKNIGVNIAIDDFGTGYSSLSYLVDFPLDVVKIDKSFIDKINEKEESLRQKGEAVVSTVIHLSHKLGCIVVAEGVEEEKQLDFLRKEKCDLIQGYYYSRPLPDNEFLEFLSKNY